MTVIDLIPAKLAKLLMSYLADAADGNVTIHFSKGRVAKWEWKMVDRP